MSIRVMTWVWEHSPAVGNDRLVLLAIADCANDEGTNAWPSVATLARKTRLHRRTVERRVEAMESRGWLAVERGAGPGGTNRYAVRMDPATWQSACPTEPAAEAGPGGEIPPNGGRQIAAPGNLPDAAELAAGGAAPGAAGGAAASAALTSFNVLEPPPPARTRARAAAVVDQADASTGQNQVDGADQVLGRLGRVWRLSGRQRRRLAPKVAAALAAGWPSSELANRLTANPHTARDPYAVLAARLADFAEPPAAPAAGGPLPARPPWCGRCDERTRLAELDDASLTRCQNCHPLRAGSSTVRELSVADDKHNVRVCVEGVSVGG